MKSTWGFAEPRTRSTGWRSWTSSASASKGRTPAPVRSLGEGPLLAARVQDIPQFGRRGTHVRPPAQVALERRRVEWHSNDPDGGVHGALKGFVDARRHGERLARSGEDGDIPARRGECVRGGPGPVDAAAAEGREAPSDVQQMLADRRPRWPKLASEHSTPRRLPTVDVRLQCTRFVAAATLGGYRGSVDSTPQER